MTNRPTNKEGKPQAEKPDLAEFSRFKVMDSYSIPAIDTNRSGGSPRGRRRLSKRQLMELDSRLSERDFQILHSIQRYRYLLSGQVQRLHFTDASTGTAASLL